MVTMGTNTISIFAVTEPGDIHQPHSDVGQIEAPCYRCPYGKKPDSCSLECAMDLDKFIQTCTSGDVADDINGAYPRSWWVYHILEYYKKVYEIIKDHGGLYISDEVQTGVGRLGSNFFGAYDGGIEPDIFTMAKGLATVFQLVRLA